jgi:hypothetical protein
MSLADRRKVRTKKWSKVYTEKTAKPVVDEDLQGQANLDFLASMWARTMLAKVLTKRIKEKVRLKSHSCKKSLLNIHPPNEVSNWKHHWGSQLMCDICSCPAIYDSLVCETCNTIVHISCVDNDPETLHEIIRQEETDEEAETLELFCGYCKDHNDSEEAYYKKELQRLKDDRQMKVVIRRIVSLLKTYVARQRFLKKRALTIVIQSCLRRRLVRKKFTQMRRNQMRVVVLDIVSLPKIDKACMVVWTVVDKFRNHQLFRLDREISKSTSEGAFTCPVNVLTLAYLLYVLFSFHYSRNISERVIVLVCR